MNFIVGAPPSAPQPSTAFLVPDNWDDWFSFRTMFDLIVYDENGQRYDIGAVKIGEHGLAADSTASPGRRAPTLPEHFDRLEETHFSLGQTDNSNRLANCVPMFAPPFWVLCGTAPTICPYIASMKMKQ